MAAPNIVNVSSIYGKTVAAALTTTLTTDILTCASDKVLKINSIIVANVDGLSAADLTTHFYDAGTTTTFTIAKDIEVAGGTTLVVLGKDAPIYLEEGDKIQAGASAANDLEIIISYEELDDA